MLQKNLSETKTKTKTKRKRKITIALAGQCNVGKSVIFNHLTGLHQHLGNWPGKTVEKAEGTLFYKGYIIDIIDLPGIYSLSTYSIEESITRKYIAEEKPDIVINVVDASLLERNLFFTIQLIELGVPVIMALNQIDVAKRKGITINHKKLENILKIPVVPTVAIKGIGISELLDESIKILRKRKRKPIQIKYGKEIECRIKKLTAVVRKIRMKYPARWIAIKLLEGDREIKKMVKNVNPKIVSVAEKYSKEIENIHKHSCPTAITCEKYTITNKITRRVQKLIPPERLLPEEIIHDITTHRIWGYPIMLTILGLIFFFIFGFGNFFSTILTDAFTHFTVIFENLFGVSIVSKLIWSIVEGIVAGITVILPYILPFYFILGILEDSGYLSRIAFLMDNFMHKIGLHGKAFIPIMLGYGCNVPACLGCRIMETHRERLIAIFVTTLIPCAAVTTVILGLVGRYVGIGWVLSIYTVDLIIILVLGRIAFKILPGEPTELIMEMHTYKTPHMKTVIKQTWFRLKEFVCIAFPLIVISSFLIEVLEIMNILEWIANLMNPITVMWLGLPSIVGIAFMFGILRKELTLIMLATLFGTTNFELILSPIQMVVFSLVTMLYIPCIATVAALVKEIGWYKALLITVIEIMLATFIGGIAFRMLSAIRLI